MECNDEDEEDEQTRQNNAETMDVAAAEEDLAALGQLAAADAETDGATFSEAERLLNEMVRLHSMLNAEILRAPVLQTLAGMVVRDPIRVIHLPVVGKRYEDSYLREPRKNHGERACVLGERCMCNFLAKARYGKDTNRGFTCTEFLTPPVREAWLNGHGLPEDSGKCLICIRYVTTYTYLRARSDPDFRAAAQKMMMQTHCNAPADGASSTPSGNAVDDARWHEALADGSTPSHASAVDTADGYRRDAMLHVDEEAFSSTAMRSTDLASIAFRPMVRFDASKLRYASSNGEKRLLQVGVGVDEEPTVRRDLNGMPPSGSAGRMAASRA